MSGKHSFQHEIPQLGHGVQEQQKVQFGNPKKACNSHRSIIPSLFISIFSLLQPILHL